MMISPSSCIQPLPPKELLMPSWWSNYGYGKPEERWTARLRIIFFDPSEVYRNLGDRLNPYVRHQTGLNSSLMFPDRADQTCPCGCGRPIKRRWASEDCSSFAIKVYFIIAYGTQQAAPFLTTYYGTRCATCENPYADIDHKVPVKHGGGGCWLSNYMLLCKTCHTDKTNRDFQHGKHKPTQQTTFDL